MADVVHLLRSHSSMSILVCLPRVLNDDDILARYTLMDRFDDAHASALQNVLDKRLTCSSCQFKRNNTTEGKPI